MGYWFLLSYSVSSDEDTWMPCNQSQVTVIDSKEGVQMSLMSLRIGMGEGGLSTDLGEDRLSDDKYKYPLPKHFGHVTGCLWGCPFQTGVLSVTIRILDGLYVTGFYFPSYLKSTVCPLVSFLVTFQLEFLVCSPYCTLVNSCLFVIFCSNSLLHTNNRPLALPLNDAHRCDSLSHHILLLKLRINKFKCKDIHLQWSASSTMIDTTSSLMSLKEGEHAGHDVTMSCIVMNIINIIILQYPHEIAIFKTD